MNPWKNFSDLMSNKRKWLGQITVIHSSIGKISAKPIPVDSSSAIVIESNGGTYSVDDYVWVDGGIITGKAPNIKLATSVVIY